MKRTVVNMPKKSSLNTPKGDNSVAELNLNGYDFLLEENLDNADQCFEQALQLDPKNIFALAGRGLVSSLLGKTEEAEEKYFQKIENIKRSSSKIWTFLGHILVN